MQTYEDLANPSMLVQAIMTDMYVALIGQQFLSETSHPIVRGFPTNTAGSYNVYFCSTISDQ